MGRNDEGLYDAEEAFLASPEGQELSRRGRQERAALVEREEAERLRREQVWAQRHPTEWRAWQRLQPLLNVTFTFGDEEPFDFGAFRKEVGDAPKNVNRVVRKDTSLPYQPGNLRWGRPHAHKAGPPVIEPASSPRSRTVPAAGESEYMTKAEVAALLRVSTRSVNRWVSQGLLKPFRRGQVLRFRREDVEAFEAKGRSGRR